MVETVKRLKHVSFVTLSVQFLTEFDPSSLLSLSAIELMYGGIYCFLCQDYIYDKDMEIIAKEEQRKAWKMQGLVLPWFMCLVCLLAVASLEGRAYQEKDRNLGRQSG